jgi:tRNA A37 N6-isopentenylltransferase MiaA
MKRTNIHLTKRQRRWLRSKSKQIGITSAELLRRVLDEYIARHARREDGQLPGTTFKKESP